MYLHKEGIKEEDTSEMDVKRYIFSLKDKGVSDHTIARKNSSLRLYFKYLRTEGLMIHNPFDNIKQPKLHARPAAVTEEEKHIILEQVKEQGVLRDEVMFQLVVEEKVKLNEIPHLTTADFHPNQGILYLPKRALVLSNGTKEILSIYLSTMEEGAFLFTNQHQKPLTESGIYFIIKSYLKAAGYEKVRPFDLSK